MRSAARANNVTKSVRDLVACPQEILRFILSAPEIELSADRLSNTSEIRLASNK